MRGASQAGDAFGAPQVGWDSIFLTRFETTAFVVGHVLIALPFTAIAIGHILPEWSVLTAFGLSVVGVLLLNLSLRSIVIRRITEPT